MPTQDFGAVCDISILTDQNSLKNAHNYFKNSGLYLPSPTYSWLSRNKLIEVRKQPVKYSLIKQEVQNRKIYPTHLPEIYDELSRQIMFDTKHQIPLTDLRGLMLGAHLQMPILTFDSELIERISQEIGIMKITEVSTNPNWITLRNILEIYREILFTCGKKFHENLDDNKTFPQITTSIEREIMNKVKKSKKSIKKSEKEKEERRELEFQFLTWDILPSLKEYYKQNILPPKILRKICERTSLLIATPRMQ